MNNQFKGFYKTPSLFEDAFYGLEIFHIEELDLEDFDISNIKIDKQLPLGKRVEFFFESMIENSKNYDMKLKNIQVIHNKNTIGEMDFIIYDKKRDKNIHIELQYKFYIYDDSFENELNRYVGPNRSDTLVLKLEKLKNRQFPLLFKEETKAYLGNIDLKNIEQKILFKGNVFLPRHLKNKELTLINNACIKGYYISFKEFIEDKSFKNMSLFLPHRYDWICNPKSNETWKNYDEVKEEIEYFINKNASPLVWCKYLKDDEILVESFFVTWS